MLGELGVLQRRRWVHDDHPIEHLDANAVGHDLVHSMLRTCEQLAIDQRHVPMVRTDPTVASTAWMRAPLTQSAGG